MEEASRYSIDSFFSLVLGGSSFITFGVGGGQSLPRTKLAIHIRETFPRDLQVNGVIAGEGLRG